MTAITALAVLAASPGLVADLVATPAAWSKYNPSMEDTRRMPAYYTRFDTVQTDDTDATIYTDTMADGTTFTTVITLRGDTAELVRLEANNPRLYVHDQGDLIRLPGMRRQFIYDVNMTVEAPNGRERSADYVVTLTHDTPRDIVTALLPELRNALTAN